MIHKKKAVSMVLLLLLLCFSMAGCSETGSEGIEVKNDDAVMKVPEKQTMSASLLKMNKMLGAGETGEYSFSELEGRWKMIYCVSSSDDSNLVNAGVNSFMEFTGDGKMRFQFFFEYVQMYVPEGEYHLCDGPMMDDILNQAWYCTLEDVNTYSEENGKCYCDFTLYGDHIIARISMDGDNVSYLGLLEKSEE
ncbi:MAG: hypothetical protein J6O03_09670 [Butyrivibrio sp.]|nr:hypothetical protein [Butyrivibrio sp.]MBP3241496.1 hypothetical protein [Oribacterium sp.]